jgi:hypothetical protein
MDFRRLLLRRDLIPAALLCASTAQAQAGFSLLPTVAAAGPRSLVVAP